METQMKIVEADTNSLFSHICSLHCALIVEYLRLKLQNWFDSKTNQTRGTGWVKSKQMVKDYLLFHLFPTIPPRLHGLKITRLNKIYISTRKSYLSKEDSSSICRYTIGHILLDYVDESPVWFTFLTNIITSNPIPHIVVPFFWFIHTDRHNVKRSRGKQDRQNKEISNRKEILNLGSSPNLFWSSLPTKYKGCGPWS